jgi:hypothetical protein
MLIPCFSANSSSLPLIYSGDYPLPGRVMRSMIPRGDPNSSWFSTPFDDPVEAANNPFGWHALHGRISRSDVPRVDVSDTHRLKSLEDENAKLKRLLADTMLDNVVLKDLRGKN